MHSHNPQVRVPLCHWINPNSIPPTALPSTNISSTILYSSFLNVYKCISSQFQACWRHVSIHTQLCYHAFTHYRGKQVGENPLCSACHALVSSLWGFRESVCWLSSASSKSLHLDASFPCHYSAHLLYTVSNSPDAFWQPGSLQLRPLDCRLYVQANRSLTAEQHCRLRNESRNEFSRARCRSCTANT